MNGQDPLTPLIVQLLYRWLTEIEEAREAETFYSRSVLFGGELNHDSMAVLESNLRSGFLLFCNRAPALAADYIRSLCGRRRSREAIRSIMRFRGSLAQAAPAELVELTAAALIRQPKAEPEERRSLEGPFEYLDHEFLPPSPAQGPFLELLTHAPQHGLELIHRLIDHAVTFHTRGRHHGGNAITILFPDERTFPWMDSYGWSREWGTRYSGVTSGLMALEAWGHRRIEAGEAFANVLADVLGPDGSQAAFLAVAVDLILSHWPESREAAIPFVACPELLCIDRDRQAHDIIGPFDFFGLKDLKKEPVGAASIEDLNKRLSRRLTLEHALGQYGAFGTDEERGKLSALLRRAEARLGPPDAQSHLGDPSFMVVHALNLIEPGNWRERTVALDDGRETVFHEYVPPDEENAHLSALQDAARERQTDANMQAAIGLALEDPSRSSPEFAAQAVAWAQGSTVTQEDEDKSWMREQAVVTAAMVAMRDDNAALRKTHRKWAYSVFAQAFLKKEDPVHRVRWGVRFNPIAIAFAGLIYSLKDGSGLKDVRRLLKVAAKDNPAGAHGLGAAAATLASVDERLPRAVLRCAFAASIGPTREWDTPKKEIAARTKRKRQRVRAAIDAELAWLTGDRSEPDWPVFPTQAVRPRRHVHVPGRRIDQHGAGPRPRPDERTDHQAAALWLANARGLMDVVLRPWIRDTARAYIAWTAAANGAGLEDDEEAAYPPHEWNHAYFDLLARCLTGLTSSQVEQLALVPMNSLPDESFFDVVTEFLSSVDRVYFNNGGLEEPIAISVRSAIARRLRASRGWKRVGDARSASIEVHIGPAIAALFFNDYGFARSVRCYLLPKAIDRLDPFLPVLQELVVGSGSSLFVALVTLNLLEVSPRPKQLPFIVTACKAWLGSNADNAIFWVDHDIGRRVCALIEKVWREELALLDPDTTLRTDVDRILAALINLGVADARGLEEALEREQGGRS